MHNHDVLSALHQALSLTGEQMAAIFALGGLMVGPEQALGLREVCPDRHLTVFLDGLIIDRRGPRPSGAPAAPSALTNNAIFKKLRIALNLHEPQVLALLAAGGQPLSKRALSPLFRKPSHKHYRACSDEVLGAFLEGLKASPT